MWVRGDTVEILLLGPVQARVDGQPINVGVRRQRFVLAVLALQPNRLVTTERLVDLCWPDDPPRTARRVVHTQISQLRATLARTGASRNGISIRGGGSGYALDCHPGNIDAHRFTALHAQARAAGDDHARLELLDQALSLWRGPAMADAASDEVRVRLCGHLEQARLDAAQDRLDALLRLGNQQDVIGEATQLVREHPHRHRLTATLILALYQAGRTADALATYRHTRLRLADELGIDPPAELRELEVAILRNDPTLAVPATVASPATVANPPFTAAHMPVPRQLPADTAAFTGRATELHHLLALLPDQDQSPTTVVTFAIDGMAGIGKTALAVHVAHRLADRHPDGQLFIDLHGYTQGVDRIEPAEALDHLLRALGVPGAQIPENLDQRAALYRTRLAGQRILIVLDNAAAEAQVAPLLPGSPGPQVLVTSRRRLTGLDHTHTLSLDTLPLPDAITLLARTVDRGRLAGQPPEQPAELVELCGRLPLAIRIAAAQLRAHATWSLSHLVGRLRDQQQRLRELAAGQRSITAALDLSYQDLSLDQQQAYQLLGLHPGPGFDAHATAALLDSTLIGAGQLLEQLHDAQLLQEPTPGRYRFHDLTRAHAAHTATRDQTEPNRQAAVERLLDYYRHTATAAMDAAYPYERDHRPHIPPAHTPIPDLPDPAAALKWLDTELPNLLATARYATGHSRPTHLLHMSTTLHRHLRSRGLYHDAETLHQQALTTALATSHQPGRMTALNSLGHIYRLQGRHTQATDHFAQALQIARTTGNCPAEQTALHGLGYIHWRQGRHRQAAEHFSQALQIARTIGHRPGELEALTGLGDVHWPQGQYQRAADHFAQALQLARAIGHRPGELEALKGLGYIHWRQGRYTQAADHDQHVLQLAHATGHRPSELTALNGLADTHRMQGRYTQAADHYQQVLQLAHATGHRSGELNALNGLGDIHRRQGRYTQAAGQYQRLLDLAQECGDPNFEYEARQGMGWLQHAIGHHDAAIAHHEQALSLARELDQPIDRARAHDGLAHAYHALAQPEQARKHWQHALDTLTDLGVDHTDDGTTTAAIHTHLAGGGDQALT